MSPIFYVITVLNLCKISLVYFIRIRYCIYIDAKKRI